MIYFDHHSTTACDPRVVEAMLPFFSDHYANASSDIHPMGRYAKRAVENARNDVASLIGADPSEILFTSCATESNNIAILGSARENRRDHKKDKIICSPIEHKSVLAPVSAVRSEGIRECIIPVDRAGRIRAEQLEAGVDDGTLLVALQAANNEIGTVQNIQPLSRLAHEHGAMFHCDAVQAAGRIPISVDLYEVDYLSISAHKMYGPKGIAALYIRGGVERAKLQPHMYGGDQEYGMRPGTINVPLVVGFGEACKIALHEMHQEVQRVYALRSAFEQELMRNVPGVILNGDINNRLPNNSSITLPGVDAEALILSMPSVALSTGSACNAGALGPSYVLLAIGLSHEQAYSTLRVGMGRNNTMSEVKTVVENIVSCYEMLLAK